MENHKAEDIVLMDVSNQVDFTDYFIICTGTSDRMLDSLSKAVSDEIRDQYKVHSKIQGKPSGGWILIDIGNIVVHIFSPDRRDYYSLEELWNEAKVLLKLQ